AVFHPNFDLNYPESPLKGRVSFAPTPPSLASPSIQIQDVRWSDEGKYVCQYAIFPRSIEQGITYLAVLAKPQNAASAVTVKAGTEPIVVARCESLNGRPEAKISWVTTAKGNATSVSKPGADNTVSVASEYKLVPTAEDDGEDISCVVEHRTQTEPESFPMKLTVLCMRFVMREQHDNSFKMEPIKPKSHICFPNFEKKNKKTIEPIYFCHVFARVRMSGEMPDAVEIQNNQLKVLKVDDAAVNTTFVCEVRNRIGAGKTRSPCSVRGE
ncbi:hypothetical protein NQD34_013371, partial [Periophthalmus magnuspinnatus]